MNTVKKPLSALAALALALGGVLIATSPATAGGSDSPTPYTVDQSGITLPDGVTFPDNGHVNIDADQPHHDLHFESKCVDRTDAECAGLRHEAAQFIGKSFIPWSAFGLTAPFCVSWVQISLYDEHYGEGGQPPVCVEGENPPTEEPPVIEPPVDEPTPEFTTPISIECVDQTLMPPCLSPDVEEPLIPPVESGEPSALAETGPSIAVWLGLAALLAASGITLLMIRVRA